MNSKPQGVLVERADDEMYHTTKRAHIIDIMFDGVLKGHPYVSLSSRLQTKFGDFILILRKTPALMSQLIEVEYSPEWAEEHKARVRYIVSGSSSGRGGSWKRVKHDFLDFFNIDRLWQEHEWQSRARTLALPAGSLKKLLVSPRADPSGSWVKRLREVAVETGIMDPKDILPMRASKEVVLRNKAWGREFAQRMAGK
jgi:hypothetical protein